MDRDILKAVFRNDFASFFRKAFLTLAPGQAYQHNWHVDAIIYQLLRLQRGENKRLIINMPPRYLKSTIASVAFPAFLHGHDPTQRQISVSYSSDLAKKFANDYRALITSAWYRDVFPGTRISPHKNTEIEIELTMRGSRLATSIGGTLTGRGGDLIIIDDPLKAQDAMSDLKRNDVNEWFQSTLFSRLDNKETGKILVVMQRVHVDDLTGFLLQLEPGGWTVLNLPAIAAEDEVVPIGSGRTYHRRPGDVLFPAREPRFVLDAIKTNMGSQAFITQYLQDPAPPGGMMIKREWLQTYDALPPLQNGQTVWQSWDTAARGGAENDFSVCTTWLRDGIRWYLLDVWRGRVDYPTLKATVRALAARHTPFKIVIEESGTALALIDELRLQVPGVIGVKPTGDKISRMSATSSVFEAGQVLFPSKAPWLADLQAELLAFPGGRHDDQVDSISQILNYAKTDSSFVWSQVGDGFRQLTQMMQQQRLQELYGQ